MLFQPWQLAAMEDYGLMSTNEGLINRVARYLAQSPNGSIGTDEVCRACLDCKVDPDSFTQSDFDELQRKLNQLTQAKK